MKLSIISPYMPAVEVAIWAVWPLYRKAVGLAAYEAGSRVRASAAKALAEATAASVRSRAAFAASSSEGHSSFHAETRHDRNGDSGAIS